MKSRERERERERGGEVNSSQGGATGPYLKAYEQLRVEGQPVNVPSAGSRWLGAMLPRGFSGWMDAWATDEWTLRSLQWIVIRPPASPEFFSLPDAFGSSWFPSSMDGVEVTGFGGVPPGVFLAQAMPARRPSSSLSFPPISSALLCLARVAQSHCFG